MTSQADQSKRHDVAPYHKTRKNCQPRYSLKYLQTAPNSGQYLARDSEQHLTLNGERRLLPGIVPPIGSQTATRSEHHLARISEHHLARISEHHLNPAQVRINYGSAVGIAGILPL